MNVSLDALDLIVQQAPHWASVPKQDPEDMAFSAGAALAQLHIACGHTSVPADLLIDRLALTAAEASVTIIGRSERASDLRDTLHLLRSGDEAGPAGAIYFTWRRAASRMISVQNIGSALPEIQRSMIAQALKKGRVCAIRHAADVFEKALTEYPRSEAEAFVLADVALSHGLGWRKLVPLSARFIKASDLRKTGSELRTAFYLAVSAGAQQATSLAIDLARKAERLKQVQPKLRAKGSGPAIELFLKRDAVAATSLMSDTMSDRAARRFCDRLVDLGVARELTHRPNFRLYGL